MIGKKSRASLTVSSLQAFNAGREKSLQLLAFSPDLTMRPTSVLVSSTAESVDLATRANQLMVFSSCRGRNVESR